MVDRVIEVWASGQQQVEPRRCHGECKRTNCRAIAGLVQHSLAGDAWIEEGGHDDWNRWLPGVLLWQLVEKDHIEQGLIHLDAAVVTDKPEIAKAIHKKSDV